MTAPLSELERLYSTKNSTSTWISKSSEDDKAEQLYWYFGYGSNLNSETFLGRRGIQPFKHMRMLVPGWRLTFDIAGIPYAEPGFGSIEQIRGETTPRHGTTQPELQGVAYLVTAKDYEHIIATEGGDSSYAQILVHAIDPATGQGMSVWTLQAKHPRKGCQPSLRYISIIRQGAKQHDFPVEYIQYLESVEPFVLQNRRQKLGARLFLAFWMPIILWLFALRSMLTRSDGTAPEWLSKFARIVFKIMWNIHDQVWSKSYGPGDHNPHSQPGVTVGYTV